MAFSDFYIQTTGSNLNAGSTSADAAVYTSTAGNWDGTSIFTPTDGQTTTSLVSVGDWASIYPTGNTTTPYIAQVTVVGAGANGTITLSTTAKFGTAPISGTGTRVCKTGGAWADFGMVASGVALNTGTVAQSTRINIKAGTYANTTTSRTFALAGTTTTPLWWRGYKTTIGDQDSNNVAVAGTDIPSITFTTGQFNPTGAFQTFSNLDISGATTSGPLFSGTSGTPPLTLYRVRITNTAANVNSRAATLSGTVSATAVYFKATATADKVVSLGNQPMAFHGCQFTGGIIGVSPGASTNVTLSFCIFDTQAGDCILPGASTNLVVTNCSFYAPTGNGINFGSTIVFSVVANCYFENVNQASKAAINNTTGTNTNQIKCIANTYYNCTLNTSGLGDSPLIFDNGTLGSAGFVAPGSQNFSLNTVAKALGFPGLFENTSVYQGYLDPGAVQRQEPASGGGPPATRVCVFEFPPSVIRE